MAVERVSFLFSSPRKVKISKDIKVGEGTVLRPGVSTIDIIEFDATLSENHDVTAEITEYPVEIGSNISDHYRLLPREITINGVVSNTPLTGLLSAVQGLQTSISSRISESPANAAYDKIYRAMKDGELLNIVTTLKEYKNMLITRFSTTRNASTGNILNATITLREIRIAKLKITTPENPRDSKDASFENIGRVDLSDANSSQSEKAQVGLNSVLFSRG